MNLMEQKALCFSAAVIWLTHIVRPHTHLQVLKTGWQVQLLDITNPILLRCNWRGLLSLDAPSPSRRLWMVCIILFIPYNDTILITVALESAKTRYHAVRAACRNLIQDELGTFTYLIMTILTNLLPQRTSSSSRNTQTRWQK